LSNLYGADDINYINLGNKAFLKGKLSEALKLYSKAGKACEETDKVYNNKGVVFASQGKHKIAIAKLTKALEYNPDNEIVLYNRATQYLMAEQYDLAIEDFESSQGVAPIAIGRVKQ